MDEMKKGVGVFKKGDVGPFVFHGGSVMQIILTELVKHMERFFKDVEKNGTVNPDSYTSDQISFKIGGKSMSISKYCTAILDDLKHKEGQLRDNFDIGSITIKLVLPNIEELDRSIYDSGFQNTLGVGYQNTHQMANRVAKDDNDAKTIEVAKNFAEAFAKLSSLLSYWTNYSNRYFEICMRVEDAARRVSKLVNVQAEGK